jgi:hypothetical protein
MGSETNLKRVCRYIQTTETIETTETTEKKDKKRNGKHGLQDPREVLSGEGSH